MTSALHLFLQSAAAIIFLGFILQISFVSQSALSLELMRLVHSCTPLAFFLLFNKLLVILIIGLLVLLFTVRSLVMRPAFLKNLSSLAYFGIGFALLGFAKLTLGELTPFVLGFLQKSEKMVGEGVAIEHNPVRIRDYSTMYGSPNGYFYFLVLLLNLLGVRVFTKPRREGGPVETTLPSRTEIKKAGRTKRRDSIDESEVIPESGALKTPSENTARREQMGSLRSNPLQSTRRFELFEKDFSVQSPENLSQADSQTSDVRFSSSRVFLEKFQNLRRPLSVVCVLLRLRTNALSVEKTRPLPVLFWSMTYASFRRAGALLVAYAALSLFLAGNAFASDLLFGFLLATVFSRFYFRVLER